MVNFSLNVRVRPFHSNNHVKSHLIFKSNLNAPGKKFCFTQTFDEKFEVVAVF